MGIFGFVPESLQTATVHQVKIIYFGNENLLNFVAKVEITQHFNEIQRNIYSKHKDDAHKKEFINLFYAFNPIPNYLFNYIDLKGNTSFFLIKQ